MPLETSPFRRRPPQAPRTSGDHNTTGASNHCTEQDGSPRCGRRVRGQHPARRRSILDGDVSVADDVTDTAQRDADVRAAAVAAYAIGHGLTGLSPASLQAIPTGQAQHSVTPCPQVHSACWLNVELRVGNTAARRITHR